MVRKRLAALLGVMMLLAGCGGSAAQRSSGGGAQSPQGGGFAESAKSEAPADVEASAPAGYGGAPKTAAADARVEASRAGSPSRSSEPAPPPRERPGLGTEWGEARTSRVHDVAFVRDAGSPFATVALNYNDRRGVEALADRAALRDRQREVPAGSGAVSVSIRDEGGDPLEAVKVGGRTFVIGEAGQRYTIVLTNRTSHRFEAVATVDGLDVVNGKPGSFDNRGYVLLPFATVEIEGFRQSASSVAAFRFAAVKDSYAAQMGSARNVGVIGVALFAERGDSFVPESELRLRESASPFPADPRFAPPPPRR